MLSDISTVFSGNPLDRADALRNDPKLMLDWPKRKDAQFLLFAGDKLLSNSDGSGHWLSHSDVENLHEPRTIFLGSDKEAPCYAIRIAAETEHASAPCQSAEQGIKYRDLRTCATKLTNMPLIGTDEIQKGYNHTWDNSLAHASLGIAAQAKSMLDWHQNHLFCAKCGAPSEMKRAGYERQCSNCHAQHFPRTDPVVIMLATSGDKALVGRNYNLPPNVYSALAGFMEPGETIEEAVARELSEEAGVRVENVRYVASQPWPWPSSLMIGCMADAKTTELTVDKSELEDARWVTRDEVKRAFSGKAEDLILPPPFAIAHTLFCKWINSI